MSAKKKPVPKNDRDETPPMVTMVFCNAETVMLHSTFGHPVTVRMIDKVDLKQASWTLQPNKTVLVTQKEMNEIKDGIKRSEIPKYLEAVK